MTGWMRRSTGRADMAEKSYKLVRSVRAEADITAIGEYTVETYGKEAAKAYSALLRQAFRDIRTDPFRPGSKERPEIGAYVRSYHTSLSRKRAGARVKSPRHLVLYYLLRRFLEIGARSSRIGPKPTYKSRQNAALQL